MRTVRVTSKCRRCGGRWVRWSVEEGYGFIGCPFCSLRSHSGGKEERGQKEEAGEVLVEKG